MGDLAKLSDNHKNMTYTALRDNGFEPITMLRLLWYVYSLKFSEFLHGVKINLVWIINVL